MQQKIRYSAALYLQNDISITMKATLHLHKMHTTLAEPVHYALALDNDDTGKTAINLNAAIGHELTLKHTGNIHCVHCGRKTKKSFNQGYCYPCFKRLAQCDSCIVKPELCHYNQGTCREPEWGEAHCLQAHYVYLANSSGVKVGITRHTQIPTRWIDQGAIAALPIFKVQSRLLSGLVEVAFKAHVADKTHWQRMLKNHVETIDLKAKRDELLQTLETVLEDFDSRYGKEAVSVLEDAEVVNIQYPVEIYPSKVKSMNFDKTAEVSGILNGIKGQYLIFDSGVINIRKFSGYEVELACIGLSEQ